MFNSISADMLSSHISYARTRFRSASTLSNYYSNQIDRRSWSLQVKEEGLFFIGCDEFSGLTHYYFLADSHSLAEVDLILPASQTYISEFVVGSQGCEVVLDHYAKIGFKRYANLNKMSLSRKGQIDSPQESVISCTYNDFSFLRNTFDRQFDRLSERYPTDKELLDALGNGSVFKFVDNNRALGFYWADTKRFLSEVRYFYVQHGSRGVGVGKAMLEHHLFTTQSVKKNQLWVLEDNSAAIALYEKFGYQLDGLQTLIFLRDDCEI